MEPSDSAQAQRQRVERSVVKVCDQLGTFVEWWGFRAIDGRVWALLTIRKEPMSQAEIARTLDVSRSLVHAAIRELEDYGLVRRDGHGRMAPWVANIDVWPVITSVLRTREWMMLEEIRVTIDAALDEADHLETKTGEQPWSTRRLHLLRALTELAQQFLRVILAFRDRGPHTNLRDSFRSAGAIISNLRHAFGSER